MNEADNDVRRIHTHLLYTTIAIKYLDPKIENGTPFKEFKANCRCYLTEPVDIDTDSVENLLEALEKKGIVDIGDYDHLKELVDFDGRLLNKIKETEDLLSSKNVDIYKRVDGRRVIVERATDEDIVTHVKLKQSDKQKVDDISAEVDDIVNKMKLMVKEMMKRGDDLSLSRSPKRKQHNERELMYKERLKESIGVIGMYKGTDKLDSARSIYRFAEKGRDYILENNSKFTDFAKDWKQRIQCWKSDSQLWNLRNVLQRFSDALKLQIKLLVI